MDFEAKAQLVTDEWCNSIGLTPSTMLRFSITDALKDAHAAGFEAGLRARMPSEGEIEKAAEECFAIIRSKGFEKTADDRVAGFEQGARWLAANMRKGDV